MPVYPQQINNSAQNQSPMGYDLAFEKQRIAEATEEIKKELLIKWQKNYAGAQIFPDALKDANPELIKFLLSFQNTLFYNDLARKFRLNQQQRDALPQIIWQICVKRQWEQLKISLIEYLAVDSATADQLIAALNPNILSKARELSMQSFASRSTASAYQKEVPQNRTEAWTVNDAIKAYPEIGEQLITSEKITLRNFPEPVRPSLKNWLADYTFNLGFEKHSSIERSNYLFHGNNAKNLTPFDRQKLSYIFKAYDENTLITVDKTLKQIIFPAMNTVSEQKGNTPISSFQFSASNQVPNSNNQNPKNSISFSSAQKLPYEKLKSAEPKQGEFISRVKFPPIQQQRPTASVNNVVRLEPKPEPPRNLPKNLVNLREE